MTSSDSSTPSWLLVWRVLLAIVIAAMPFWMWIAPGGFPVDHPRFWANRALPAIVFAIAAIGLFGVRYQKYSLYQSAVLFFPVAWTSAVVCGIVAFPVSSRRVLLPLLLVAVFLWVAYAVTCRRQPRKMWALLSVIAFATVMGIAAPLSQRAPDADTQPQPIYVIPPPVASARADEKKPPVRIQLSEHLAVRTIDGTIYARHGNLRISIEPFLQFDSRSPDRCWTLLAPRRFHVDAPLALTGYQRFEREVGLELRGNSAHWLFLDTDLEGTVGNIDAYTVLDQDTYSHLNVYSKITIHGHSHLQIAFTPCPETPIEARPADYPTGRPARIAYLSADGQFRVVEATSGEKGPFQTLAEAHFDRAAPLGLTFIDDGQPICRIAFADWAFQCGVTLSPTAGWGVPVNAIEFQRIGDDLDDPVVVWMTLAATSVGRGWDSVGHKAGTYRNRIEITDMLD